MPNRQKHVMPRFRTDNRIFSFLPFAASLFGLRLFLNNSNNTMPSHTAVRASKRLAQIARAYERACNNAEDLWDLTQAAIENTRGECARDCYERIVSTSRREVMAAIHKDKLAAERKQLLNVQWSDALRDHWDEQQRQSSHPIMGNGTAEDPFLVDTCSTTEGYEAPESAVMRPSSTPPSSPAPQPVPVAVPVTPQPGPLIASPPPIRRVPRDVTYRTAFNGNFSIYVDPDLDWVFFNHKKRALRVAEYPQSVLCVHCNTYHADNELTAAQEGLVNERRFRSTPLTDEQRARSRDRSAAFRAVQQAAYGRIRKRSLTYRRLDL